MAMGLRVYGPALKAALESRTFSAVWPDGSREPLTPITDNTIMTILGVPDFDLPWIEVHGETKEILKALANILRFDQYVAIIGQTTNVSEYLHHLLMHS